MNFFYAYVLMGVTSTLVIKWTNSLATLGKIRMNLVQAVLVLIGWPLILPLYLIVGIPNLIENRRRDRLILPLHR